jgi:hypothetical protein
MKRYIQYLSLVLGRLDQHHIRLGLLVLTLILLVIGAGAPEDCGGHGCGGG